MLASGWEIFPDRRFLCMYIRHGGKLYNKNEEGVCYALTTNDIVVSL